MCAPAAVSEKFIVGDIMTMPGGGTPVVMSIEFGQATGVRITGQVAFTTADRRGYYLHSLAALEAEDPNEWAARMDLPAREPIDITDDLDYEGEARAGNDRCGRRTHW